VKKIKLPVDRAHPGFRVFRPGEALLDAGLCRCIISILLRRLGVEHAVITQADLEGMVGTYLIEGFEGPNLLIALGYRDKSNDN
jgi:hypothetical protein